MCTYFWWPILYTYLLLVTYSLHLEVFKGLFCTSLCLIYSVHVFVCTSVICTSYFVYFVSLGELIFTWHIYYLHVLLVTYSVQKDFLTAYSVHIPPYVDLNFFFYGLFFIFTSPWWAYFYIYNARMSADLICTPTLSWWPILYICNFLKAYSVYILPHV